MYAPYALHVAIPAMMIGHLTFAGLAELFVSGGSGGISAAHKSSAVEPQLFSSGCSRRRTATVLFKIWLGTGCAALDSSGAAHGSDAAWYFGSRHGLGRMERARLCQPGNAPKDCGGVGQRRASSTTASRAGTPLNIMERALSAVRASLRSRSRIRLCDVGHVRLRLNSWNLLPDRLAWTNRKLDERFSMNCKIMSARA